MSGGELKIDLGGVEAEYTSDESDLEVQRSHSRVPLSESELQRSHRVSFSKKVGVRQSVGSVVSSLSNSRDCRQEPVLKRSSAAPSSATAYESSRCSSSRMEESLESEDELTPPEIAEVCRTRRRVKSRVESRDRKESSEDDIEVINEIAGTSVRRAASPQRHRDFRINKSTPRQEPLDMRTARNRQLVYDSEPEPVDHRRGSYQGSRSRHVDEDAFRRVQKRQDFERRYRQQPRHRSRSPVRTYRSDSHRRRAPSPDPSYYEELTPDRDLPFLDTPRSRTSKASSTWPIRKTMDRIPETYEDETEDDDMMERTPSLSPTSPVRVIVRRTYVDESPPPRNKRVIVQSRKNSAHHPRLDGRERRVSRVQKEIEDENEIEDVSIEEPKSSLLVETLQQKTPQEMPKSIMKPPRSSQKQKPLKRLQTPEPEKADKTAGSSDKKFDFKTELLRTMTRVMVQTGEFSFLQKEYNGIDWTKKTEEERTLDEEPFHRIVYSKVKDILETTFSASIPKPAEGVSININTTSIPESSDDVSININTTGSYPSPPPLIIDNRAKAKPTSTPIPTPVIATPTATPIPTPKTATSVNSAAATKHPQSSNTKVNPVQFKQPEAPKATSARTPSITPKIVLQSQNMTPQPQKTMPQAPKITPQPQKITSQPQKAMPQPQQITPQPQKTAPQPPKSASPKRANNRAPRTPKTPSAPKQNQTHLTIPRPSSASSTQASSQQQRKSVNKTPNQSKPEVATVTPSEQIPKQSYTGVIAGEQYIPPKKVAKSNLTHSIDGNPLRQFSQEEEETSSQCQSQQQPQAFRIPDTSAPSTSTAANLPGPMDHSYYNANGVTNKTIANQIVNNSNNANSNQKKTDVPNQPARVPMYCFVQHTTGRTPRRSKRLESCSQIDDTPLDENATLQQQEKEQRNQEAWRSPESDFEDLTDFIEEDESEDEWQPGSQAVDGFCPPKRRRQQRSRTPARRSHNPVGMNLSKLSTSNSAANSGDPTSQQTPVEFVQNLV